MKKTVKQLLKAICYMALSVGMQIITTFVFMFIFMIKQGIEAKVDGRYISENFLIEESTNFLLNKSNTIVLVSGIITLLFLWLFFKIRKKRLITEAYIKRFDGSKVIPIILLGFSFALFILAAMNLPPIPERVLESYSQSAEISTSGSLIIMLITIVIVAPIVEEIIFRGLILSRLNKAMNTTVALIISSLLFAILHGHILWIAYTFVLGILFGIVAIKTESILPSIILHMSFNLAGLFVGLIPFPDWSMGIVCLVSFIISAILVYFIVKKTNKE